MSPENSPIFYLQPARRLFLMRDQLAPLMFPVSGFRRECRQETQPMAANRYTLNGLTAFSKYRGPGLNCSGMRYCLK